MKSRSWIIDKKVSEINKLGSKWPLNFKTYLCLLVLTISYLQIYNRFRDDTNSVSTLARMYNQVKVIIFAKVMWWLQKVTHVNSKDSRAK